MSEYIYKPGKPKKTRVFKRLRALAASGNRAASRYYDIIASISTLYKTVYNVILQAGNNVRVL